jgi:hypothetical protein
VAFWFSRPFFSVFLTLFDEEGALRARYPLSRSSLFFSPLLWALPPLLFSPLFFSIVSLLLSSSLLFPSLPSFPLFSSSILSSCRVMSCFALPCLLFSTIYTYIQVIIHHRSYLFLKNGNMQASLALTLTLTLTLNLNLTIHVLSTGFVFDVTK